MPCGAIPGWARLLATGENGAPRCRGWPAACSHRSTWPNCRVPRSRTSRRASSRSATSGSTELLDGFDKSEIQGRGTAAAWRVRLWL